MYFRRNFHQLPCLAPLKHLTTKVLPSDISLQLLAPTEQQLSPWDTDDAVSKLGERTARKPLKFTPAKKPMHRNLSQMQPSATIEFPCYKMSRTLLSFQCREASRDPQRENNHLYSKKEYYKSPRVKYIERKLRIRDLLIDKMRNKDRSSKQNKIKPNHSIDCKRRKTGSIDKDEIMLFGATIHNFRKD